MRRAIQIILFTFLFFAATNAFAQQKAGTDSDTEIKEVLYTKYKKEVQAYDKKEFDALFFDYFKKQKDQNMTLTKEEFYSYTIKIAIYSEKLGLLYKDQKAEAHRTKQEWFDKSYADYLNSKK
ncbi:hypothetical protein [Flavobacterium sp.]|uniref:hypothetical protein n=1 Tax=Flavobacterium sp. TaxID=239 RepID=UPI0024891537|nr:hypothetical protein [Flavobacterium sp.]MDI1317726.1 hypothetical protein [Flavobacterium sp.]